METTCYTNLLDRIINGFIRDVNLHICFGTQEMTVDLFTAQRLKTERYWSTGWSFQSFRSDTKHICTFAQTRKNWFHDSTK